MSSKKRFDDKHESSRLLQAKVKAFAKDNDCTTLKDFPPPAGFYTQPDVQNAFKLDYGADDDWKRKARHAYKKYVKEELGMRGKGNLNFICFVRLLAINLINQRNISSFLSVKGILKNSTNANNSFFDSPKLGILGVQADNRETGQALEPIKHQKRCSSSKESIMINQNESDLDDLFVCRPRIITANTNKYAIMIIELPFFFDESVATVVVEDNGRQATVSFKLPHYLVDASKVVGIKLKGVHNIVSNSILNWVMTQVNKKGDDLTYKLVLDLPFEAETSTSSDLLGGQSGSLISLSYGKAISSKTRKQELDPALFVSTLVLVFKERSNDFCVSTKVKSSIARLSDSSDEGGVWNW